MPITNSDDESQDVECGIRLECEMRSFVLCIALTLCVVLAVETLAVKSQIIEDAPPPADVSKTDGIRPLSPSEAVGSLRVKAGLHVELVASEPLIESPVAIAFGADGKLWVAEMCDYPQEKGMSGEDQGESES